MRAANLRHQHVGAEPSMSCRYNPITKLRAETSSSGPIIAAIASGQARPNADGLRYRQLEVVSRWIERNGPRARIHSRPCQRANGVPMGSIRWPLNRPPELCAWDCSWDSPHTQGHHAGPAEEMNEREPDRRLLRAGCAALWTGAAKLLGRSRATLTDIDILGLHECTGMAADLCADMGKFLVTISSALSERRTF